MHAPADRPIEQLSHPELLVRHNAERDRANQLEAQLLAHRESAEERDEDGLTAGERRIVDNAQAHIDDLTAKHTTSLDEAKAAHAAELAESAKALEDAQAAHAEALEKLKAEHAAQLDALTAPPAAPTPDPDPPPADESKTTKRGSR